LNTGALATLTNLLPTLSSAERRIAEAIMADPMSLLRMTVSELARKSAAGDATVVRLCQRAGWSGFTELKLRLAADLARPEDVIHVDLTSDDDEDDIVAKLSSSTVQAIRTSRKALSLEAFRCAVEAISTAAKTEFYGLGTSGLVGLNAKMRFSRIGVESDAHTDVHFQRMAASRLDSRHVAFCISHSGATSEIVEVMEIARGKGARCIALTNHSRSPLARMADVVLLTAVREALLATGSMESEIAQLYVINLLYVAVAMRNVPQVLDKEVKYLDVLSASRGRQGKRRVQESHHARK